MCIRDSYSGEHLLARRAVNKEVADKIYEIVTNMENRAKSIGCDMRKGQPTDVYKRQS